MESIFHRETVQKYIDRIHSLTPQTQAQWGKMNVAQMLSHCQAPIKIASGELVPKIHPVIKFLFAKNAKKQLLNDPEFKRNLPTFREAKVVDQRVFEVERTRLVNMITEFQQKGPAGLTKAPHPFFGELQVSDWDFMQVKHLDHHLRQFGV
ncbi:hypothetical protein CNR22_07595 [Sphingobacteriaceae bacterium]|nr:hypothetical protein CNR22_07595 [Sphingobacteriaceae bacterium]